jgi:hypothetical protein
MDAEYGVFGDGSDYTDEYTVTAHGTTKLTVIHTNASAEVAKVIAMYERWLQDPMDRYKIVGLDLEYTRDRKRTALLQLSMRNHCLLYHVCRAKSVCPELREFLHRREIYFASVDIKNDTPKLERDLLVHVVNHVDLQRLWRYPDGGTGKAGMARLASDIIDREYAGMKIEFPKHLHERWEWRHLDYDAIKYAARDAYVCYEMLNRIWRVGECAVYHY